ncbi:hypothetical protein KBI52_28665 [Microvirga sp. HBU67558]|uniref:hypothetical protein n=1 Tax=Microvirga TaxID=186650 RepID=UPI001B38DCC9|nr:MULTISPECIES: hypothetical protein [unclassified Microvirga]MBQ0824174.1 hypothetical protein [Microvirga sp. HBU67558]
MMLAYGRAAVAVVTLAQLEHENEAAAVDFVDRSGTKDLPKQMRRLFRGRLEEDRFLQMDAAVTRFKEISEKRHHLIHGEWWFDVFDGGHLVVRKVRRGKIEHLLDVTPSVLEDWTQSLEDIADELDEVWYSVDAVRSKPTDEELIQLQNWLDQEDADNDSL